MNRLNYYFRQKVEESELDLGFAYAENAQRSIVSDRVDFGVFLGAAVVEKSGTPNMTVDVATGVVYDKTGRRTAWTGTQNVNVAVDSLAVSTTVITPGNSKILSVFARFVRTYADPRTDGNALTVFFEEAESFELYVKQGAEGVSPTPPALEAEDILLADITLIFGQTSVLNADIDLIDRREDAYVLSAGVFDIRATSPRGAAQALLQELNDHFTGVTGEHPASAIAYAGGPNWANAVTNPAATVEAQLDKIIADLVSTDSGTSGAHKTGCAARTAWLDTTANAVGSIYAAINKIITDLNATAGAARIGAAAVSQSPTSLSSGSVRSQLDALLTAVNARGRLASAELVSGAWSFDGIINFNAQVRFNSIVKWRMHTITPVDADAPMFVAENYDEVRFGAPTGSILYTLVDPTIDGVRVRFTKPAATATHTIFLRRSDTTVLFRFWQDQRHWVDLVSDGGVWKVSATAEITNVTAIDTL